MPPWVPGDFLHFLEKPTTFSGFCFNFAGENGTRNQTFQPLSPGTAQLGGYMLFVNENFTRVREELAAQTSGVGGIQPSFSSIAKELGVVSLRWGFLDDWYAGVRFCFFLGGVLVEDGSKESRTPMLVRRVGNWLNLIFFGLGTAPSDIILSQKKSTMNDILHVACFNRHISSTEPWPRKEAAAQWRALSRQEQGEYTSRAAALRETARCQR